MTTNAEFDGACRTCRHARAIEVDSVGGLKPYTGGMHGRCARPENSSTTFVNLKTPRLDLPVHACWEAAT